MLMGIYSMLVLLCLVSWGLVGVLGVEADEVQSVSVMEGGNVTLHTDLTELQRDDLILWSFGDKGTQIAELNRSAKNITLPKNNARLKLNEQTGSLTITNITIADSGLYKAQMIGNKVSKKNYNVIVVAHLPVPIITSYCPQNPPSSERSSVCVVLCSVLNVSHVSLSWYKGSSLLSSISVSDLNIRLSLPLEVDYEDTNTHTCVLNNSITNHTQHLNITQLCQPCSDQSDCVNTYDTSEAVIRLVVSALMGVAAVAASVVLIYDIKSRREEKKRKDKALVTQRDL